MNERTNYTPRTTTEELHAAIRSLAETIASGQSDEAFDQYLTWISRLHRYSWGNIALMMVDWRRRQEADPSIPPLSHAASYRTWKRNGRQVRRGERGIAILVPIELHGRTVTDEATGEDDYLPPRTMFRVGYVFDVSQTEGDAVPNWKRDLGDDSADAIPLLATLARERHIEVVFEPGGDENGYSTGGRIAINAARPVGIQVQTMVHELAHELLNHAKAKRNGSEAPAHAVLEAEAEAVTVVVLRALGHDTVTNGAAYIRSHGADAKTVTDSLQRIANAARTILIAVLPDERAQQAPAPEPAAAASATAA